MSKKKITPLEWMIRFLIILLFCVALFVGFQRLDEWHELKKQKEELEKEKSEMQQQAE